MRTQRNLCRISIIAQLSAAIGFNHHVYISNCVLQGNNLVQFRQFEPLFLSDVNRFKRFHPWSRFCLNAFAGTGCGSYNMRSGWTEVRRAFKFSDSGKGLTALLGALWWTEWHSKENSGFLASFISLSIFSHLSKSLCALLGTPPRISLQFRVSTVC